MVDESIIDKVKKLLRMAEHPGSNPNEAAIAMEKAQKIMEEYRLKRVQILEDRLVAEENVGVADWTERPAGYLVRRQLLATLAQVNLCRLITTARLYQMHLFGTKQNIDVTRAMYEWIVKQLEDMAKVDYARHKALAVVDGYRVEREDKFVDAYLVGAVETVVHRLKEYYDSFATGTGRALVTGTRDQLDVAVRRVFPVLWSGPGMRVNSSSAGYGIGRQAGSGVSFGKPIREVKRLTGGKG